MPGRHHLRAPHLALQAWLLCAVYAAAWAADAPGHAADFEKHYAAWKAHCTRHGVSSRVDDYLDSPDYRAIVEMGPSALPLIIEKSRTDAAFRWLGWAHQAITRVHQDPGYYPWCGESVTDWSAAEPSRSLARFEELAAQWERQRADGAALLWSQEHTLLDERHRAANVRKETELGKTYRSISALGIVVLPAVIDKIRAGKTDYLYLADELTQGNAEFWGKTADEQVKHCLDWWEQNKQDWLIPWPAEVTAPE